MEARLFGMDERSFLLKKRTASPGANGNLPVGAFIRIFRFSLMLTSDYGNSGERVSFIGLGGAFLTANSFADGVATVRKALDLGVTYFDTSPMYCRGASQAVLGEALDGTGVPHLLGTKLGYFARPERFRSPEALRAQFEESLRLLRRDRVDTLLLHEADLRGWWADEPEGASRRLDPDRQYTFAAAPAFELFRELKDEGRIRFCGISGNTAGNIGRVLEGADVEAVLLAFNYDLLRRGARSVLSRAKAKGAARMIGALFQRGLAKPQPELLDNPPGWMTQPLADRYRALYKLQGESGLSLAAMGVRFLVGRKDELDVAIIGAKSPEEIEECARAVEAGPLPEDLLAEIEKLALPENGGSEAMS